MWLLHKLGHKEFSSSLIENPYPPILANSFSSSVTKLQVSQKASLLEFSEYPFIFKLQKYFQPTVVSILGSVISWKFYFKIL
jgi:hypothetical protein